jgi:hypothetical protein
MKTIPWFHPGVDSGTVTIIINGKKMKKSA